MILVTGATGTIGRPLIEELKRQGATLRATTRSRSGLEWLAARQIDAVATDFDSAPSVESALAGAHTLFLLTPWTPSQQHQEARLLDIALAQGVQRIVLLSVHDARPGDACPILADHAASEMHLRQTGIAHVILRPNSLMQNIAPNYGTMVRNGGFLYLPLGTAGVSWVDARDVAAVAAVVLVQPGHEGTIIDVTGDDVLTGDNLADGICTVTGAPCRYVDVPTAAMTDIMRGEGAPMWLAEGLASLFDTYRAGRAASVSNAVRRLTGRDPRVLKDYLAEMAGSFRP